MQDDSNNNEAPSTEPTPETPVEQAQPDVSGVEATNQPNPTPAPAPVTPIGSGPANTSVPTSKMPKKSILIGAIVAGAVVVLGGGFAAAYNLWYQNPEKVVFDALTNAAAAKSATFTASLEMEEDDGKFKFTMDGKASEDLEAQVDITASIKNDSSDVDVDGSIITDKDGNIYIKVNKVAELLEQVAGASTADTITTYLGDVIDEVDGHWIKVSSKDLKEVSEDYGDQQECLTDAAKSLSEDKAVKKEVEDLFKKNKFITVAKKLGSKDINGTGSLGYQLAFDGDKAYEFVKGLADTKFGKALKDCDSTYDFSDVRKSDFEDDSDVKNTVEVWVSRWGHQLTEFSLVGKSDDFDGKILFQPKFNVPVKIDVPSGAKNVKDVYQDYLDAIQKLSSSYYTTPSYNYGSSYNYDYDYSSLY